MCEVHVKGIWVDPFGLNKDSEFCNVLTSQGKNQLASPTYKTLKNKSKAPSPSPFLVDPVTVQMLRQMEPQKPTESMTTGKKKSSYKSNPAKVARKKKSKCPVMPASVKQQSFGREVVAGI